MKKNTISTEKTAVNAAAQAGLATTGTKSAAQIAAAAEKAVERAATYRKSAFGRYCEKLVSGKAEHAFSVEGLKVDGGLEDKAAENLLSAALDVVEKAGRLADLREAAKVDPAPNSDAWQAVKTAERDLKDTVNALFMWAAWRPGNPRKNGEVPKKPCYKMQSGADFTIIGEIAQEARKAGKDTDKKAAELLCLAIGRILTGKPLGRVSKADIKRAKEAAQKTAKEKREQTAKRNAEKAAAAEQAEKEQAEQAAAYAARVAKLARMIETSAASDEEKQAMLAIIAEMNK